MWGSPSRMPHKEGCISVFASSDNVGDSHCVVIDYIGKIVSREAVRLDKDLIVKILVGESDITVNEVMIRSGSRKRHLLSDYVRHACIKVLLDLFS